MFETLIAGVLISLLAVVIGVWVALRIQRQHLLNIQAQQEAWERAQEGHQRVWEVRQEKQSREIENKLTAQVQDLRHEWRRWEAKDAQRAQAWEQRYETTAARLSLEHELARLPLIEETPLPASPNDLRQHEFANWQPPRLQGANLSQRDFSYRYLGRADLRAAQLKGTSFYMADLSGAALAGADLSGSDLSGANLTGVDLRNAILKDANLLVADLHHAVLIGADLRGGRNLTAQQIHSAIIDSTTQLDDEVAITLTGIPSVRVQPRASIQTTPTLTDEALSADSIQTSSSTDEQSEPAQAIDTTLPATKDDASTPPVETGPVNPVEASPSDRIKPKLQSLKPPVLLPLSPDDSEPALLSTHLDLNGQHHDGVDGVRVKEI